MFETHRVTSENTPSFLCTIARPGEGSSAGGALTFYSINYRTQSCTYTKHFLGLVWLLSHEKLLSTSQPNYYIPYDSHTTLVWILYPIPAGVKVSYARKCRYDKYNVRVPKRIRPTFLHVRSLFTLPSSQICTYISAPEEKQSWGMAMGVSSWWQGANVPLTYWNLKMITSYHVILWNTLNFALA